MWGCWLVIFLPRGAEQSAAPATITLEVINVPLDSVLKKITKKTRWKIKVPDKWLDRPVTQTLNKASLEEGLRSVLNNAGIGNLLIKYDEYFKVVTVFDTESAQNHPGIASPVPVNAQPPVVSMPAEPDSRLQRAVIEPKARRTSSGARRRSSGDD
jgi:hypothetical protein